MSSIFAYTPEDSALPPYGIYVSVRAGPSVQAREPTDLFVKLDLIWVTSIAFVHSFLLHRLICRTGQQAPFHGSAHPAPASHLISSHRLNRARAGSGV